MKWMIWGWFVVGVSTAPVAGQELGLAKVRQAISERGARWIAGPTSLSGLSREEKRRRLGAEPGPVPPGVPRFAPPKGQKLPAALDWRANGGNFVTPIRDQGGCGSCWAFGATAVFESAYLIQAGMPGVDLDRSEQDVVSCSEAGNCQGGFVEGALGFMHKTGIVDEACFPYAAQDLPCSQKCADWAARAIPIHGFFYAGSDVESIQAALQQAPLTFGFTVYDDFFWYQGGVYEHVTGEPVGYHLVALVGYDDAEQAWICKNSWGPGWGEQGFFRIRYNDIGSGGSVFGIQLNRAPVFDSMYTRTTRAGEELRFSVIARDPDGDEVRYAMEAPPELLGAAFDGDRGEFVWTPPAGSEGMYRVRFVATDRWDPVASTEGWVWVSVCASPCDDGNFCTDDTCPGGVCQHQFNNAIACPNDGNSCTDDNCREGSCYFLLPDGDACDDDGSECTTDECHAGACVHAPLPDGTPCPEDWVQCTEDACRGGWCSHALLPDGTPCDDKRQCNGADRCVLGECLGTLPPECIDGLDCTRDDCDDYPVRIEWCDEPFEDIARQGTDIGLFGDDVISGPIEIGFDWVFPLSSEPLQSIFVSVNGVINADGVEPGPKNLCLPDAASPTRLLAVYWDDLYCAAEEGCRLLVALEGAAPARRFIVQWHRVRPLAHPTAWLDFEAILREGGGLDYRYLRLAGDSGRSATVGLTGDDPWNALSWSCEGQLPDGLSLRYADAGPVCIRKTESGTCAIDGACWLEGEANPGNLCLRCLPWFEPFRWSSDEGAPCDDGLSCTREDFCWGGACRGHPPKECDDLLECTEDGCRDAEPLECTHTLLEGYCLIDGACYLWGAPHPADPCLACRPDQAVDHWSPADGNGCDDGDNCTFKDTCQGGWCSGIPYSCNAGACVASAECDGGGLCALSFHPAGTPCEKPLCLGGVLHGGAECDGAGTCLPFGLSSCGPYGCADEHACATSCANDDGCDPSAYCEASSGECRERKPDGDTCQFARECQSDACGGGYCCPRGADCCALAEDCPAVYQADPVCHDPGRCQGARREARCNANHQCESVWLDDDSACTAFIRYPCPGGGERLCTGEAEQPDKTCLDQCLDDEDCDEGSCIQGLCLPGAGAGSGCACDTGGGSGVGNALFGVVLLLGARRRRGSRRFTDPRG